MKNAIEKIVLGRANLVRSFPMAFFKIENKLIVLYLSLIKGSYFLVFSVLISYSFQIAFSVSNFFIKGLRTSLVSKVSNVSLVDSCRGDQLPLREAPQTQNCNIMKSVPHRNRLVSVLEFFVHPKSNGRWFKGRTHIIVLSYTAIFDS